MLRKIFSLIFLYVKSKFQPGTILGLGLLSYMVIMTQQLYAQETTPPEVTVTSLNPVTSNPVIDFTVAFSEATTGFIQSDLMITNGTINSLGASSVAYTYNNTFGTTGMAGTSNALLSGPGGVAIASNGDILIADRNNHRIQIFNNDGVYQSTIGNSGLVETDNTGFNAPNDVAVDSQGNIYVVDQNNNRIQIYSPTLVYQSTIGSTTAVPDNTGFDNPYAIAIDGADNLYISDANNHRIQIYGNSGTYTATIGTGTAVNNNTGFNTPRGVAVNTSGNIYVADLLNQRVQIFGPGPSFSYLNTLSGLVFPSGVAVKDNGELYVTEQLSHRLLVYDNNLTQVGSVVDGMGSGTGSGSDNDQLDSPAGVTLGGMGEIFIADPGNQRIQIFNTSETYPVSTTALSEGDVVLSVPAMVASDAAGNPNLQGSATVRYDITAPVPTISTFENSPTNASSFDVTVDFSEPINNFSQSDITVSNGSVSNFLSPSDRYRFDRTLPSTLGGTGLDFLDVAVGTNDLIYVLDDNNSIVYILDDQGNSIGTFGSNELSSPRALTIDTQGDVYVVDDSNSEAFKYSANGTFINSFGSSELSSPQEIVVGPLGNIYIVDDDNSEVYIYNSSLLFTGSFGGDELSTPTGIAIDNPGNKYVLDNSNEFIAIYNNHNDFVSSFPINPNASYHDMVMGSQGALTLLLDNSPTIAVYDLVGNLIGTSGNSDLGPNPRGMGLDNLGKLYVTGSSDDEIDIFFPPTDGYVATVVPAADGILTINIPANSASDLGGNLSTAATPLTITSDQTPPEITLSASVVSPTSATIFTVTTQFSETVTGLTIDDFNVGNGSKSNFVIINESTYSVDVMPTSDGNVTIDMSPAIVFDLAQNSNLAADQLSLISDRFVPTVALISSVGNMTNISPFSLVATFSEEISGFDLADIVVTNGAASDLQMLASEYTFIGTIGQGVGSETLQLRNPRDVAIDPSGNIYICDQSNNRIQIYDSNWNYLATLGNSGVSQVDNTGFNTPSAVDLDASGNIYVSDQNNERVQIFDANRSYIGTIGTSGQTQSDNSGFDLPSGVAVDPSGNIYVCDRGNHRVQVFDSNRNYVATMGISGQVAHDNTGFSFPTNVAIDEVGNIYVTDESNHRVQIFDSNRNYIATLGTSGVPQTDNTGFDAPSHIAIDPSGNIYVTDSRNIRVQIFDSNRNYIGTTGTPGPSSPDPTGVTLATGVNFDMNGKIYISDLHGDRVQIYQPPMPAYSFSVTPVAEGTVTVEVPVGAFNDAVGKANSSGEQLTLNYDITPPTATFQGSTGFNSVDPITITLVFSEETIGFDQNDFSTFSGSAGGFNATLSSFTQIDNLTYVIEIIPDGSSQDIDLIVLGETLFDHSGNANQPINGLLVYDTTGPILSIQDEPAKINSTAPFNLRFEFDQNVLGFELEDLVITNGIVSNLIRVDGNTFTADLTPDGNGNVIISLPAGLVEDELGNLNSPSFPVTILLDNIGPGLLMSTSQNPTNASMFDIFVTFDEMVTDFDQNDIVVTNGVVNTLSAPSGLYNHLSSQGSSGSGSGELNDPEDIAFDNVGNMYVVESLNDRVQVFDVDGNSVTTLGSEGTGNDQFSSPTGIHIDSNGLIYIADRSNHRVQVFDAGFNYINTIGTFGVGFNQLNNPSNVYVDDSGSIYILDRGNGRVQVYNSDFNYVRTIGSRGIMPGQLLDPSGIALDVTGNIYVAESSTNSSRIQVFNNSGNLLHSLGNLGSGNSEFSRPEGIFVDDNGTVYVADTRNNRIQVFDRDLQYVSTIGGVRGTGNNELEDPTAVILNNNGDLVVADSRNDRIQIFSPPLEIYTASITASMEGLVEISIDAGSLTDLAGNANPIGASINVQVDNTLPAVVLTPGASTVMAPFEVTAEFTEEVTGVTSGDFLLGNGIVSNLTASNPSTYTITVSPLREGNIRIDMNPSSALDLAGNGNTAASPVNVAFDQTRPEVVLSTDAVSPGTNQNFDIEIAFSESVFGFDPSGLTIDNGSVLSLTSPDDSYNYVSTLGTSGSAQTDNSGFNNPQGIATDAAGNIFISDQGNHRVQVYGANGLYLSTIGSSGQIQTDNTGFNGPSAVATGLHGHIYIVDRGNHRVQVYDANFTYLSTLGVSGVAGSDNLNFSSPQDVAVDISGNIYVADSGNRRIQVFNSSLTYLFTIDHGIDSSDIFGTVATFLFVHVDLSSNIYVTDNFRERIVIFDALGNYTGMLGTTDQSQSDNTGFRAPSKVSTDFLGNIYVADGGNERIQVFGPNRAYLTTLGTSGVAQTDNNGFASNISDVSADSNNQLYIADPGNQRIQIYELPTNTYRATLQAAADGPVTAQVNTGVATDVGGSTNTASNLLSVTVDINPPGASITSLTGITANKPFSVTIQFTEVVTGFDVTDITAGNATLSDFDPIDGDTYAVMVTPLLTGLVTIDIGIGAAQDIIGNDNTAALQFTRTFDPTAFTGTISTTNTSPVNSSFDVNIDFSRRTTDLDLGDITLNNGTGSNFTPSITSRSYGSTISTGSNNVITPFGLAVNADGHIFVAGNNRIEVYDASGTLIDNIGSGSPSSQAGEFNDPRGIAFDASGRLYVVDRLNHRVQVFDGANLSFQQEFGSRGSGDNQFEFPSGIAIAPNGNILIADNSNERVQIFDANFNYIATLGTTLTQGNTNALLRRPADVYVDRNGRIYVADTNNDRIQIFESDLTHAGTIGTGNAGSANDALNNPIGVFVDGFGDIYIADLSNHRVQVFGNDLTYKTTLGTGNSGSGNDAFNNPSSVALNALGGHLYISDQGNNRVQTFAIDQSMSTVTITPVNEGLVTISLGSNVVTDGIGRPNVSSDNVELLYDNTSPIVEANSVPEAVNNSPFTASFVANNETMLTGVDLADIVVTNGAAANLTIVDATSFTVLITPDGGGHISLEIPAGSIADLAGNTNATLAPVVVAYDITPPDLVISTEASNPTNDNPILTSFSFSENVTGFDATDVIVSNGILSNFSGTGNSYFASIVPIADGEITVNVMANIAVDIANNGNTSATEFSIVSDRTIPTIFLSSILGTINNRTFIPIDFSFNEAITGFADDDIVIENGSLFSSSLTNFTVAPSGPGELTVTIPQASFFDQAGNGNTTTSIDFILDYTPPTLVEITTPAGNPNNLNIFSAFLTFSEAMGVGFGLSDIAVSNGTASSFTNLGTSMVYQINIAPDIDGPVTITIPDDTAFDVAGNTLTGASPTTIISDRTGPTVSISTPLSANSSGFTASISLNESPVGFEEGDIDISNGTIHNFSGSGTLYTMDILPTGGDVSIFIPNAVFTDVLGNLNSVSNNAVVTLDNIAPTIVLSTTANDPSNETTLPVTIAFSEEITGLEITDFVVTNATLSNLTGTGANYSLDILSLADGQITLQLDAQTVFDLAGNGNVVSNILSLTSDQTVPTVTVSTITSSPTNQDSFLLSVDFSENVSGFEISDIVVTNGVISNFTGANDTYSATVTSTTSNGIVTVSIANDVANDDAGNLNTASNVLVTTVDLIRPSVVISAPPVTNGSAFTVIFDFDESVIDFTASDVTIVNATISNFSGTDASYSADLTPDSNGTITIEVLENVAIDLAGNTNLAATAILVESDQIAPGLVISTLESSPTKLSTIPVVLTFSEDVTGLLQSEIIINNGTSSNLLAVSSAVYTIDIAPTMDGTITIDVDAGVVIDQAGNGNLEAAQLSIVSDQTSPDVVISSTSASPTNSDMIPVSITFSEPITGFSESDLTLSNGTVVNFTGTGTAYSLNLQPVLDGAVTLEIAEGVAMDDADNLNTVANQFSATFDRTPPTVTIQSTVGSPTATGSISISIDFSESITGFTQSDVIITNSIISNFSGSGSAYTLDLEPILDGLMTLEVPAGVAEDDATNLNIASNQLDIVSDRTAPTTLVSSSITSPTNADLIMVSVTFSEPITGFTPSDLTINNGLATNFMGSGATYTLDLEPLSDGLVTLEVLAGVAEDEAMNLNMMSNELSIISDKTSPTISISSTITSPTNASLIPVTITFSESVTGFTLTDLSLNNGSGSNFTGSGSIYTLDIQPISDGLLTLDITEGIAIDEANNANVAASQFSITSDRTRPTVTLSTTSTSPTNADIIPVTISFSESMTGFTETGLTVSNGTATNLQGAGNTYTVDIAPTADGTVSLEVFEASAIDAAGNNNIASAPLLIESDKTHPTVTLNTTITGPTNEDIIPLTISFSEPVIGFTESDLTLMNALSSNFSGSGSIYTVDISSTATSGIITIDVSPDVSTDPAGNTNTSAPQLSIEYDSDPPLILEISRLDNNPIIGTSARYRVLFSENVRGIEVSDFELATTGSLTANVTSVSSNTGTEVTVVVDGIHGNGSFELSVPEAASMTDIAGNTLASGFTGETYTTNVAPNDILLSTTSIAENNAIDETIGTFRTEDGNTTDTHTYTFAIGEGDTHNGDFNILNNELRASSVFDFETQNNYSIRIQTIDNFGQTFQKVFSISITNVGEPQIRLEGSLQFQSTEIGSTETLSFDIHNDGDGDLTVSQILYPTGFSGDFSNGTIASSGVVTVQVTFAPTEELGYSGEIEVQSDAGNPSIMATGTGQVTTAIEDDPEFLLSKSKVFPNPASKNVTIDLVHYKKSVDISVRNIEGKELFNLYDYNGDTVEINVSGLQQGMYFIYMNSSTETAVRKLIIKR